MASAALKLEPRLDTMADLLHRLGDIPPERILMHPPPGTATEEDLLELLDGANKRICELVDGVLVEKPIGFTEGTIAGVIIHFLWDYLEKKPLGVPAGADGPVRLRLGLVRFPDARFVSWKRFGGEEVPDDAISKVIPELAIEVLSKSNTRREIALKLEEYFRAGVVLVWVIDPKKQTADVHTTPANKNELDKDGVLDGAKVLPGFRIILKDLFARARKRQRRK